jgi:hypothetical protein
MARVKVTGSRSRLVRGQGHAAMRSRACGHEVKVMRARGARVSLGAMIILGQQVMVPTCFNLLDRRCKFIGRRWPRGFGLTRELTGGVYDDLLPLYL